MPCFHPLTLKPDPKRIGKIHTVPCGRCIGCKIEKARQWAVRGTHEMAFHQETCFVTLTKADTTWQQPQNDGTGPSISLREHQLFMKRLLKELRSFGPIQPIKLLMCGEYGEKNARPHYHYILFGYGFPDKRKFKKKNGHQLYRSDLLEKIWPYGQADIAAATFNSINYVAGYVTKKITGEFKQRKNCWCGNQCRTADEHYARIAPDGTTFWLTPEFNAMSRRPGLGKKWIEKYRSSVYPNDRVVINGKAAKPPRYYDEQLKKLDQNAHERVKTSRDEKLAQQNPANQAPARLRAGEKILHAALNQRKRDLK